MAALRDQRSDRYSEERNTAKSANSAHCGDIPAPTAAAPVTAPVTAKPANPQQAHACQEFASKLQGAQGNPAQAQQIYAMGSQKLSGMFGPNPCPNLPKP